MTYKVYRVDFLEEETRVLVYETKDAHDPKLEEYAETDLGEFAGYELEITN